MSEKDKVERWAELAVESIEEEYEHFWEGLKDYLDLEGSSCEDVEEKPKNSHLPPPVEIFIDEEGHICTRNITKTQK